MDAQRLNLLRVLQRGPISARTLRSLMEELDAQEQIYRHEVFDVNPMSKCGMSPTTAQVRLIAGCNGFTYWCLDLNDPNEAVYHGDEHVCLVKDLDGRVPV